MEYVHRKNATEAGIVQTVITATTSHFGTSMPTGIGTRSCGEKTVQGLRNEAEWLEGVT